MSEQQNDGGHERPRDVADLQFVGSDFARPECVLTTAAGEIFASDRRGGIRRLAPDGESLIGQSDITPNGFAMLRDRSFLVANLAGAGGVWKIDRDGSVRPHLTEIEGVRLPGVNFVMLDHQDRLWITVSTMNPEVGQYSQASRDGFLAVQDSKGVRIVAGDLCWTNECRVSNDGSYLYVNETFARRLTRFPIRADGSLGPRETATEFGPGVFPDGLAFDTAGCAWVVSVGTNRIIRIEADGSQTTVIDDGDPATVEEFESLHNQNALTRPQLSRARGTRLVNTSSIAFGGADLRTAYVGSLGLSAIATFKVNVPGVPPPHWTW